MCHHNFFLYLYACVCTGDLEQQAGLLASERQRSEELREEVEALASCRAKLKAQLAEKDSTLSEYTNLVQQHREEISMLEAALDEKREKKRGRQAQYEDEMEVSHESIKQKQ